MPVRDVERLIENRVNVIRQYHKDAGIERAELDVSGGVDSAVMLGLLSRALGPENVTAVYQGINSSQESLDRAREVCKVFGVNLVEIDLSKNFNDLVMKMHAALHSAGYDFEEVAQRSDDDPTILGSIRSCIRAPIGRGFNRMTGGGIRHGTGNECEDRWLRFYQKGGDGEVDTNPLAMLSKGEVFQLGRGLGVPNSILSALPTPDLWGTGEGHNDEDELKSMTGVEFTYSRVDPDTGEYTRVGTIERVSRFADDHAMIFEDGPGQDVVYVRTLCHQSVSEWFGMTLEDTRELFHQARKMERITRHKMNPNCPSLGNRGFLVRAGILTNELPEV